MLVPQHCTTIETPLVTGSPEGRPGHGAGTQGPVTGLREPGSQRVHETSAQTLHKPYCVNEQEVLLFPY